MRHTHSVIGGVLRAAAALALVAAVGATRSAADDDDENVPPVSAAPRVTVIGGETVVTFDAATLARSGIATEPLAAEQHQAETPAYGSVLDLTDLAAARGALGAAAARVAKAQAALAASNAEFERVRTLHAEGRNASDKMLQDARARWQGDMADASAAETELSAQEAAGRQQWGSVVAGWLERGSPALDALLAQRERLVQVTVPPATPFEQAPAAATVRVGGATVAARLISAAARTDPRIQGASFYYAAPATAGLLPGAAVAAFLPAGRAHTGVVVPSAAVVWWQGRAWVYLEQAPGRFVRRAVATDTPVAGGLFVSDGVAAGSRVVVRGAQMLLSEEGRGAVQGSEG